VTWVSCPQISLVRVVSAVAVIHPTDWAMDSPGPRESVQPDQLPPSPEAGLGHSSSVAASDPSIR
jgi:hypothetical protein